MREVAERIKSPEVVPDIGMTILVVLGQSLGSRFVILSNFFEGSRYFLCNFWPEMDGWALVRRDRTFRVASVL